MKLTDITCPVCRGTEAKSVKRTVGKYRFLNCPACSFQFIHPYTEPGPAFDDYSWTKEYTEHYDRYTGPVIASLRAKIEDAEKIMGRKPTSFLDIGCGNGLYLHAANVLGLKNLGTDVDRVNVEFAKGKGLNALAAAIEDLELPDKFEFVHLKAVLHLVPDPVRLIRRSLELLAPGGVVYVDVPNQGSLFSLLKKLRERTTYGQLELPLRRGAFNTRSLKYLCGGAGYRVAKWIFTYPGNKIYYPILGMNRIYRNIFKVLSNIRIASFLGAYLVEKDIRHESDQGR